MRIMTVALGTALVLCDLGTFSVAAHAQKAKVVREPRERPLIRVPVVRTTPYWDYYIVPRYRYRPEDDRVDPCGGPVVPVIRYGSQRKRFRCGWRTLWVLAVCMVEIGRVRVKAGNAPIEQKQRLDRLVVAS